MDQWLAVTIGWARGAMHNYSTLGRQAEPKGGIERATGRAMPWALATTPPTIYSNAPIGGDMSMS